MYRLIAVFIVSFCIGIVLSKPILFLLNKLKAKQNILEYVEQHKAKQGIPTMGGFIFLIPCTVTFLVFREGHSVLAVVCLSVTCAYGLIGALDDGIKIVLKRNLGLRAYQKIISQSIIALLVCYFCYNNQYIGGEILLPFSEKSINVTYWFFPICFFLYIASTNAVNLTDGLDGLAGTASAIYIFCLSVIIGIYCYKNEQLGLTFYEEELRNLLLFSCSLMGGISAFLWQNVYKANVFMGDTGSLALGGACCSLAVFIKQPLLLAICGFVYIISAISVIIQVFFYKIKGKRIFLMAPFHHHLEKKGYAESKIVAYYAIIGVFFGAIGVLSVL